MRMFVAVIVTIVIFFLISTPVTDVNSASYSASFVPQEIMPVKSADEIVSDAFSVSGYSPVDITDAPVMNTGKKAVAEAANPVIKPETAVLKPESEIKPGTKTKPDVTAPAITKSAATKSPGTKYSTPKSSAAPSSSSVKTSSKAVAGKYYVIIGVFKTGRPAAQTYIGRLKGDVAGAAGMIERDGKVLVYAQQFSGEKAAQSYLNKIRQNPNHRQAWLYKGR
jgi:hypothetical protein